MKVSVNSVPHYELTTGFRRVAIEQGAAELFNEECQPIYRQWREALVHGRRVRLPRLTLDPFRPAFLETTEILGIGCPMPGLVPPIPAVVTYELLLELTTKYNAGWQTIHGVATSPVTAAHLNLETPPEFSLYLINPSHVLDGIPRIIDPRMDDDQHQVFTDTDAWAARIADQAAFQATLAASS